MIMRRRRRRRTTTRTDEDKDCCYDDNDDDDEEEDNKDMDVCIISIKREEEGVLILLLFVWFPSDNTLFIAPGPVICTNMASSFQTINNITQLHVSIYLEYKCSKYPGRNRWTWT